MADVQKQENAGPWDEVLKSAHQWELELRSSGEWEEHMLQISLVSQLWLPENLEDTWFNKARCAICTAEIDVLL
jgi:hypothetical protein